MIPQALHHMSNGYKNINFGIEQSKYGGCSPSGGVPIGYRLRRLDGEQPPVVRTQMKLGCKILGLRLG